MKTTNWKKNSAYSKFPQSKKDMLLASVERIRKAKKEVMMKHKADFGCCMCGEKDPIVLEFHHKTDDSKHPVLKRRNGNRSLWVLGWDDMFKEMEKCNVMCANCHRRHTYFSRRKV